MVSGLWTKGERASGQMDNIAVCLTYYLQILKMVDLGRKGSLASQRAERCKEALSHISSAMGTAGTRLTVGDFSA